MQFRFDFDNNQPIYLQLVEQLELYIISGKLSPGERLPSVRDLALLAKVNPNTMQRALQELEDLRLVITERTTGKRVTTDAKLIQKCRLRFATSKTKKYLRDMEDLGFAPTAIIKDFIRKDKHA